MSDFIEYLKACINLDGKDQDAIKSQLRVTNAITAALSKTKKKAADVKIEEKEAGQNFGILCRLFDNTPPCVKEGKFKQLQNKYCELIAILHKQPSKKNERILGTQIDFFAMELFKECTANLLNENGELQNELSQLLLLDSINMTNDQRTNALIFSYVHCLQMAIVDSIRDKAMLDIAKKYDIHAGDGNVMSAINSMQHLEAGRKALKEIQESLENQRQLDRKIQICFDDIDNIKAIFEAQKSAVIAFVQTYILVGHTQQMNAAFIEKAKDGSLTKSTFSFTSLFEEEQDTVGNKILKYIMKNHADVIILMADNIIEQKTNVDKRERDRANNILAAAAINVKNHARLSSSSKR